MDLFIDLKRSYSKEWTTGIISINSVVLSYSIELPWKNNQIKISCIPEGIYELEIRKSRKFQTHIWIKDVNGRTWILFHPANNARKELKGCIAPVMELGKGGVGFHSRIALNLIILNILKHKVGKVFLRISS